MWTGGSTECADSERKAEDRGSRCPGGLICTWADRCPYHPSAYRYGGAYGDKDGTTAGKER